MLGGSELITAFWALLKRFRDSLFFAILEEESCDDIYNCKKIYSSNSHRSLEENSGPEWDPSPDDSLHAAVWGLDKVGLDSPPMENWYNKSKFFLSHWVCDNLVWTTNY